MIRASEISEYVYCRKMWWLGRVSGEQPEDKHRYAAGIEYHANHQERLVRAQRRRKAALVLLFLAVTILLFWTVRLI